MSTREDELTVDGKYYVNEATVELLTRRIEADVRKSFWGWIGLPIGGAGILGVLYIVFVAIPNYVVDYVATDDTIKSRMDSAVIDYLKDEARGGHLIKTQTEEASGPMVQAAVPSYLASKEGQHVLREGIDRVVAEYYQGDEGRMRIRELVGEYMNTDTVRDLIRTAVSNALRPAVARLSDEIQDNLTELVVEIAHVPTAARLDKGAMSDLHDFLGSREAQRIQDARQPITLGLTAGKGRRYAAFAIYEYISELEQRFGSQFEHVLVLDERGKFLALIPAQLAAERLRDGFMDVVNSTSNSMPRSEVLARLSGLFDPSIQRSISTTDTAAQALRNPLWLEIPSDVPVAVLDPAGEFVGVTTRRSLVEGVLG